MPDGGIWKEVLSAIKVWSRRGRKMNLDEFRNRRKFFAFDLIKINDNKVEFE